MEDFKAIQNRPVENLRGVKLNLSLSRLVRDKPGLIGANVTGTQQSGKSVYGLLVMYELYKGNVDEIFKHLVFNVQDLTNLLNEAIQKHERMICVMWDDASVTGAAGMYNVNRRMVQFLSAMGDTMGLATKGLIMTSPSADLIKSFRNYNFYRVNIGLGRQRTERIARGYEFNTSPFGQKWGRAAFVDEYDLRIPFYQRYYELREKLSVNTLKDMDTFLHGEQPKATMYEKDGKRYVEMEV